MARCGSGAISAARPGTTGRCPGTTAVTPSSTAAPTSSPRPWLGLPADASPCAAGRSLCIKTPGDFYQRGGCFHNIVGDPTARVVWDDPDHTIKTGAVRALYARKPEYRGRVKRVEVQRWEHGMPLYSIGRMKTYDLLGEPV